MRKLIYSVREIFDTDPQNGCLGLNGCRRYYIAPYQRGYKWQTESDWNSPAQVNTLLRDIYDAWRKDPRREYFLQFVTVKRCSESSRTKFLEVIDGQQRLTTLSIILSVLKLMGSLEGVENEHLTLSKIDYACSEESQECLNGFFEQGKLPDTDVRDNDQTVHFLCEAKEKTTVLLGQGEKFDGRFGEFVEYFLTKVMLIVNVVQDSLKSEKVFGNLNGRKVVLTDMELIKGLLLCRAAREGGTLAYHQVLERRAMMGRSWDEIERWLADENVAMYFFGEKNFALYDFLLLVIWRKTGRKCEQSFENCYSARFEIEKSGTKHYRLFNWYYAHIQQPSDAVALFNEIEDVYWALHDIYDDVGRYNASGFLLFRQVGLPRVRLLDEIARFGVSWEERAFDKIAKTFTGRKEDIGSAKAFIKSYQGGYADCSEQLRQDLMLLNCFVLKDGRFKANDKRRFPFYDVQAGSDATKSLEHVQPQHPAKPEAVWKTLRGDDSATKLLTLATAQRLTGEQYKPYNEKIITFLGEKKGLLDFVRKFEAGEVKIPANMQKDAEPPDEFQPLVDFYGELMQAYNQPFETLTLAKVWPEIFGDITTTCKDSIGNIVLVTGALNSALSNRNFAAKRLLLRNKLNQGENVPPHTFNVFSKFSGKGTDLDCWFISDVLENAQSVIGELFKLRNALSACDKGGRK